MHSSAPQPEFLVDRSLGRYAVPEAIRAKGYVVHTLSSVYGRREQDLDDTEQLRDAGAAGWVVLTKDQRIRRRPLEIAAIVSSGVRCFVLAMGELGAANQVDCFLASMPLILDACRRSGPVIYAVREQGIRLLWPPASGLGEGQGLASRKAPVDVALEGDQVVIFEDGEDGLVLASLYFSLGSVSVKVNEHPLSL